MIRHGSHRLASLFLLLALAFPLLHGCGEPNDPVIPPTQASEFDTLTVIQTQAFAQNTAVVDGKLYLSQNFFEVLVYDFSDPSAPVLEDTLMINPSEANGRYIDLVEDSPFIVVNNNLNTGVYFKDSLTFANFSLGSSGVLDMLVLSRMDSVVLDYDYQNHYVPVLAILLADRGDDLSMDYVFRDCTYVAVDSLGGVWNMPPRPISGQGYFGRNPEGLAVLNGPDTLACGLGDLGVGSVNISPNVRNNIDWLSVVDTPGEATHLTVQNGYIYAADGTGGLAVIDATDISNLEYVANWSASGLDHVIDVAVQGNYLALLDKFDGVVFLDITEPAAPEYMGMYEVREPTSVRIEDNNIVLITSVGEGLAVLELTY